MDFIRFSECVTVRWLYNIATFSCITHPLIYTRRAWLLRGKHYKRHDSNLVGKRGGDVTGLQPT